MDRSGGVKRDLKARRRLESALDRVADASGVEIPAALRERLTAAPGRAKTEAVLDREYWAAALEILALAIVDIAHAVELALVGVEMTPDPTQEEGAGDG